MRWRLSWGSARSRCARRWRGSSKKPLKAFDRAARVATDADRRAAIESFERLDDAAEGNLAEVAMRNREFHTALVRPGDRILTTQVVERLTILAERYVIAHLAPAGRDERAHVEHRGLLDAWLARDEATIVSMLSEHIAATLDDLRIEFAAAAAT
jgi:DNA-binding GntR family transcriptional regulator